MSRARLHSFFLAALAAWGGASTASAAPGPQYESLRPLSMGNAFVAIVDDKDAIYYNPAGLNLMGQLGNKDLRPDMAFYPEDKFDMHMDLVGTAIPFSDALQILRFWEAHQAAFGNLDSLQKDSSFSSDLSKFDRRPVPIGVMNGGELAIHNFGMAYWANAQMAPYADVGVLLPQAGLAYLQLDVVGQVAGATSFLDHRLSVGVGYRMAKRERVGNIQVAVTDLQNQGRQQLTDALQDTLNQKLSQLTDLGSIGHGIDLGALWQQTQWLRFGGAIQNLGMVLNHQWITPTLTVGLAMTPVIFQKNTIWERKVNFALDLEDLLDADRNYKPLSKINVGAEWEQTLIPWVLRGRLAVGLKGGYMTAGLGGTLFSIFTYEFATWADEAGYYTGQIEDRYYVMKFGVGI